MQVQRVTDRLEAASKRGVQVAVYWHGELVVDAPRPAHVSPLPSPACSPNRVRSATTLLIVEERPEFGSHGTHVATVRQVLTGSAGVLGVPVEATPWTGSMLGERP